MIGLVVAMACAGIAVCAVEGADSGVKRISVDAANVLSNVKRKPGGFLTCWLLDSDKERPRPTSMVETYRKLGVQSIRYPFGALANNYLWTTPPYENAAQGLTPRVATMSKYPAEWEWAVNGDGTFKKDLDFDEFIGQCRAVGAEPVIVVNVMSHKYKGGPSLDQLRQSAVEWVRYSNVTRKYGVKYWQLGNEQDHHKDELSLEEYTQIYGDFARAMKAVDPTIKTGVAIINNKGWASTLLKAHPAMVDFIGCHQYQWRNRTFDGWKDLTRPLIPNILSIDDVLQESTRPDAEIMVTEMSSYGKWFDGSGVPDMARTLCLAEMLLHAATVRRVVYTHFWTTHSAWNGENVDGALCSALTSDNTPKPTAHVIGLINNHLDDVIVDVTRVQGDLRVFASRSNAGRIATIFIINKSDQSADVELEMSGFYIKHIVKCLTYMGKDYEDLAPVEDTEREATLKDASVYMAVPGISLTIVKLEVAPRGDARKETVE
jgi:hypothetical protein